MKFSKFFLTIAIVAFLFGAISPPTDAQTSAFTKNASVSSDAGVKYIDFQGTINSGDSIWSGGFQVGGYSRIVSVSKVMDQANDSAKIKIERWQSPLESTWILAKTLATSDSTQTANYTADTLRLQNQKLLIIGNAGTGLNATFKVRVELSPP